MSNQSPTLHPGRRQLMRGAAWALPTIAIATAAPAFAASSACKPYFKFSGGILKNLGTINAISGTTNQWINMGGQTTVYNLPAGVTVKSIDYQFWIQNRIGQASSGPGFFFLSNSTSDKKTACGGAGCSVAWSPTAGSGFVPTVTNTANQVNHTFPTIGVTSPSWDVNMKGLPDQDTNLASRYTTAGACQNFDSGPSSKFTVNYTGVTALTSADVANGKDKANMSSIVTVTLSNGQILTGEVLAV